MNKNDENIVKNIFKFIVYKRVWEIKIYRQISGFIPNPQGKFRIKLKKLTAKPTKTHKCCF
jgi:hypothetical protein